MLENKTANIHPYTREHTREKHYEPHKRHEALLEVIRHGLELAGASQSFSMLGNRAAYIGMSDIARYVECPRAILCGKLLPQSTSLERLLILQRGHWFEHGIAECFIQLKSRMLQQLEISISHHETPIRAHLDFTLVWEHPQPTIRVLEVKSMSEIPSSPFAAHETQIAGQIALLYHFWNTPSFSLKAQDGTLLYQNVTMPELCKSYFGLALPPCPDNLSIEAWLLCVSMKSIRAYGPYIPKDYALEELLRYGHELWDSMKAICEKELDLSSVAYAQGYHRLCSSCQYASDCPKFSDGDYQPQWEPALERLGKLKHSRTEIDHEIKELEDALKQAYQLSDTNDWITAGKQRFRCSYSSGRRILDRELLTQELRNIFSAENLSESDLDELFRKCEMLGKPSSRLSVSPAV